MKYVKTKKVDYALALVVFGLVVFGLVMIYSASSVLSYERFGKSDFYLNRQLISFAAGILAWIFFQSIDYHFYKKISLPLFFVTFGLLILVFVPGVGHEWRGSHRWIGIGNFIFQPAELVKLSLILYLAAWFEKIGKETMSFKKGFLPFVFLLIVLGLLLIKQPDLGTLTVLAGIAVVIYFIAGALVSHLILGAFCSSLVFVALVKFVPYRMARIVAYLNPEQDPLGIAYHVRNALIAIGSGGLLGLGFGQSHQKHLFLPEAHTDSIFAIISEELGFLRASFVILAFAYLAYRGYKIAKDAPDVFGRLMAAGITTWFVFQAFINIAGITGLLPFTGVPLPFISYGGTSLVVSLAGVGILLNISKHAKQ